MRLPSTLKPTLPRARFSHEPLPGCCAICRRTGHQPQLIGARELETLCLEIRRNASHGKLDRLAEPVFALQELTPPAVQPPPPNPHPNGPGPKA